MDRIGNKNIFRWVLMLLSGLVLLFIIAPLAGLFVHTGASEFFETVRDKEVHNSIWLTLWVSFTGTFLFAFGAIPLSWLLARRKFPLKNVVQGLIDLPVVLPHTAAGIALLGFISRDGLLGKTASSIGLDLVNHPSGIALAMAFVSLPYLINSARDGLLLYLKGWRRQRSILGQASRECSSRSLSPLHGEALFRDSL
jgi:molybdate/tungstate transport system permease protein